MGIRRLSRLINLAQSQVRATATRTIIAALGIAIGTGMLMVVVGLGLGIRDVVLNEVMERLPVNMMEVRPKSIDLGIFKTNLDLFGRGGIDANTVRTLRRHPLIGEVFPKVEVKLPLGARGGSRLFGRRMYAELFMVGISPQLVADHVDIGRFREDPSTTIIPVIVSNQLLEVYNQSVAPAMGTPQLSADMLIGFEFEIEVGRSLMLGSKGARTSGTERGRIVGVSPYALKLGVSVPTATAERLLKKYALHYTAPHFASMIIKAKTAVAVPEVRDLVRSMGLEVDDSAKQTSDLLRAGIAIAALIASLVLLLAALNIAHTFFASLHERRRELAILRAIGARQADLFIIIGFEAVMIGALGAVMGGGFANIGCAALDYGAHHFLPNFPFKPESFFVLPLWLYCSTAAAAILASIVGALWPTLKISRAPLTTELMS